MPNEERADVGEESHHDRPEALSYPAKLTEREHADIAAQIRDLPAEVAQQMLDIIEAQIRKGSIKTNPAAVLRGIVRKYCADPASFDPSPGFHVADQRRRHAAAAARLQAAAEARNPVPATSPQPARQNGRKPRPAGLDAMLQATRQALRATG